MTTAAPATASEWNAVLTKHSREMMDLIAEGLKRKDRERAEYRRWPSTGNLIALYPGKPLPFGHCVCIGQDGHQHAAKFDAIMRITSPATRDEFMAALKAHVAANTATD